MIVGLREARIGSVREEREHYAPPTGGQAPSRFPHEDLHVYQAALRLICWVDGLLGSLDMETRYVSRLDKCSTSIVLNIAEGNGRFSVLDHRRFIDIAYTAAMRLASTLDVLVARGIASGQTAEPGKRQLAKVVPMLLGMRRYLKSKAT